MIDEWVAVYVCVCDCLQISLITFSLVNTCELNMNVDSGTLKIWFLIAYCFSVSFSDSMCTWFQASQAAVIQTSWGAPSCKLDVPCSTCCSQFFVSQIGCAAESFRYAVMIYDEKPFDSSPIPNSWTWWVLGGNHWVWTCLFLRNALQTKQTHSNTWKIFIVLDIFMLHALLTPIV